MDNEGIAAVLEQVADLLEIEGASPFRVRAYRGAARTVSALASPAGSLPEKGPGALEELPGIGKDLAGKIREIAATGELGLLHELKERTPESLIHLLEIPGLGPKRAKAIHEGLGIDSIEALEKAAKQGLLRTLKGVGPKLEAQILEGIAQRAIRGKRILLAEAESEVEPIVDKLRKATGVQRIEVAGSYRRRRENVGDVDILVAADASLQIGKLLISHDKTEKVLADGETKTSVVLRSGLQVDLRVVPLESFGAALHYFTGSKAHNIAVRTLGVRKKLKINEYGVFDEDGNRVAGDTEESVFGSVGLGFVPPELREDRGEVDASREGKLPLLCVPNELVADLIDAKGSDEASLTKLIEACAKRGLSLVVVLAPDEQAERDAFLHALSKAKKHAHGMVVLSCANVGIREDGSLEEDKPEGFDIVRAVVRAPQNVPEKELTKRIVTAIASKHAHLVARPVGLYPKDKPAAVDAEAIAKAAKKHGALLELDARPERLGGAEGFARAAKEAGARLFLASHATGTSDLEALRHGLDQARRGWAEAKDIANTLEPKALEKALLQS